MLNEQQREKHRAADQTNRVAEMQLATEGDLRNGRDPMPTEPHDGIGEPKCQKQNHDSRHERQRA